MPRRLRVLLLLGASTLGAAAAAAPPPLNPHLAPSSWPIYHANTYATASVLTTAIVAPDRFETVDNLTDRRLRPGSVSPWTVLRPPTPDGDQIVLTTPNEGVAKYAIVGGRLRGVDFLGLERRRLGFDWGVLLLADGSALVTERQHNRFAVVGDRDPSNPTTSPLAVLRRIPVDRARHGELTAHFTLAFDGRVLALTEKPMLLALDLAQGRVVAEHALDGLGMAIHNSFPVDERGRIYLVGQRALVAIDWTGGRFREAWRAPYGMRGPGFENVPEDRGRFTEALAVARGDPGTGSGTTPTLLGTPDTGVVVVVDGHAPRNNLVAFWRDRIPDGWQLPDPNNPGRTLDRRVAGVLALPHSTPEGDGHTAENSPAVWGNAIVVAQWAGFSPGRHPPRGVQRVDWDPEARTLRLVWANPDVHLNGVPTIARGPNGPCVVGMGREHGRYVYSILDLETGTRLTHLDLGDSDAVLDQGNNHVVAADGSILFGGRRSLVRVYRATVRD